jgi:protein-tyrosine-phosphatase
MAHAICAAEAAQRNLQLQIYSAGVYDFTDLPPVADTLRTCLKYQTPVCKEESTFVSELPISSIDRFLVMEQHHADALVEQFGISPERVSLLADFDPKERGREIADPLGLGSAYYEHCYERIRDCVINFLQLNNRAATN